MLCVSKFASVSMQTWMLIVTPLSSAAEGGFDAVNLNVYLQSQIVTPVINSHLRNHLLSNERYLFPGLLI